MNTLIINTFCFILLSCIGYSSEDSCKYEYWEDLSNNKQLEILNSKIINQDALTYYNGEWKISDNEQTFNLLDSITLLNENIKPFYLYLFNRICNKSDGALSEVMGNYCQKIILSDPKYVFAYLANHSELLKKYAQFLGYELYFKEDGTSDIKYNLEEFKTILTREIEGCSGKIKQEQELFIKEIEETMKNME